MHAIKHLGDEIAHMQARTIPFLVLDISVKKQVTAIMPTSIAVTKKQTAKAGAKRCIIFF